MRHAPWLLLLAACAPDFGPLTTYADYCRARNQLECEFAKKCLGVPADKCDEMEVPNVCDFKPEANGFVYDAKNARACLEHVYGIACDTAWEFDPVCTVLKGSRTLDQSCGSGAPCDPALFCAFPETGSCGACATRKPLSSPCNDDFQCEAGSSVTKASALHRS
jgi:hypothetical protein